MNRSREGEGLRAAHLAVLLGASLLAFAPFLLAGVGFLYGDVLRGYRPLHLFAMEGLFDGAPLWCPLAGYGHPLLAAGELPVFYPPALAAYLLFGVDLGLAVLLPFHAVLAAVLTFLLARRIGASAPASAFAGLAFALSGWMMGHLVHAMFVWSASWLPGVLLGILALISDEDGRGRLLLPFSVAGALLACSFPVAFVIAVAAAVFLAAMLIQGTSGGACRGLARVIFFALLGAGIAAVLLLPVAAHLGETEREAARSGEWVLALSYHPLQAATLLSPFALGKSTPGMPADPLRYFGKPSFQELSAYVGALSLFLAVFALFCGRRRRIAALLWLAVGTLFLVALGRHTPFGRMLAALPGFSHFRVLPRFLLPATLALGLLAALGLDGLLAASARLRRRASWALLALGGLAAAAALCLLLLETPLTDAAKDWMRAKVIGAPGREAPEEHYLAYPGALLGTVRDALWRPAILALAAGLAARFLAGRRLGWLLVALLALDLASMHWLYQGPEKPPRPEKLVRMLDKAGVRTVHVVRRREVNDRRSCMSLGPNTYVEHGFASPATDSQMAVSGWGPLWEATEPLDLGEGSRGMDETGISLLRTFGVDAVLYDFEEGRFAAAGAEVLGEEEGVVALRVRAPRPFAWCAEYAVRSGPDGLAEALGSEDVMQGRAVVLAPGAASSDSPGDPDAGISLVEERPTRLVLDVEAGSGSILVVRGAYARGWTALVNGRETPVLRANGILRAVKVPAGESRVEMEYEPPGFVAGAAVSLLALLATSVFALARRKRRPQ